MLQPLRDTFVPRKVVVVTEAGAPLEALAKQIPWLDAKIPQRNKVTAYACQNYVCRIPVTDPNKFRQQLSK